MNNILPNIEIPQTDMYTTEYIYDKIGHMYPGLLELSLDNTNFTSAHFQDRNISNQCLVIADFVHNYRQAAVILHTIDESIKIRLLLGNRMGQLYKCDKDIFPLKTSVALFDHNIDIASVTPNGDILKYDRIDITRRWTIENIMNNDES